MTCARLLRLLGFGVTLQARFAIRPLRAGGCAQGRWGCDRGSHRRPPRSPRAKNFAESDRIRDELAAMGIALKDGKDPITGEPTTTWEVKR
jgi:hypothetical protein